MKPCVEFSDSGAYPSGHAIQAALWADLLGAIHPEHAAAFARRAEETRHYKLISGVHYASDLMSGQNVGKAVARELLKKAAVQKIIRDLQAEASPHLRKKPSDLNFR